MPDISETLRNMNDIFLSTVYVTYFTLENDYVVQVFTALLLLLFNLFNISWYSRWNIRVGNLEAFVCICLKKVSNFSVVHISDHKTAVTHKISVVDARRESEKDRGLVCITWREI